MRLPSGRFLSLFTELSHFVRSSQSRNAVDRSEYVSKKGFEMFWRLILLRRVSLCLYVASFPVVVPIWS